MAKAFLSHSSVDKELVERIAKSLGPNKCHYDRLTFEVGNKTIDEIISGIGNSDLFVLFISNDALESEWVKKEIRQAKESINQGIINRVFPLIIDNSIDYRDDRIPSWIRKPYNLQTLDNEVLILKKIRQLLRIVEFKQHKHLEKLNELFVGRNDLMQEFETKFITINGSIPSCIISYNYIEGIGRRTFLKNALKKVSIVDKLYEPVIIPIESKESIEDYIYKLNLINLDDKVTEVDLSEMSIGEKLQIARDLTFKFTSNNEIVFIEDQGSIILPNTHIAEWFKSLLRFDEFQNQVCFCIVSKYKPSTFIIKDLDNVASFRIPELSRSDTQSLFLQYLKIMGVDLTAEYKLFFIEQLNGIPAQTIYAANLISASTAFEAKRLIQDIQEYSDHIALSIYDFFSDDEYTQQVLIALSKFEIVSYDLISKLFDDEEKLRVSLQSLFDLSAFNFMFSGVEYLKLNAAISDYINRSRIQLNDNFNEKLKLLISDSLKEQDLDRKLKEDYSEFLFTLQNMVLSGKQIPKKFFIPSYILKTIVQKYYNDDFDSAIKLSEKLLENQSNYDDQIIRETKYWLCQAYARKKDDKFFEIVKYFKLPEKYENKDYYFLLGFYHRCNHNLNKAEEYYNSVLEIDDGHSRTKRELVIVYMMMEEYGRALGLARDNYLRFPTNIYHAQAYFTCLIKKQNPSSQEYRKLAEIMEMVGDSLNQRAKEIYEIMRGEYEFYINKDLPKSISILNESLKVSDKKIYAYRSLYAVYKKSNMKRQMEKLENKYGFSKEFEDE